MFKRSISLLVALAMAFCLVPLGSPASAAEAPEGLVVTGGVRGTDYTYENGQVTILKNGSYELSMAEGFDTTADRVMIGQLNGNDKPDEVTLTLHSVRIEVPDDGIDDCDEDDYMDQEWAIGCCEGSLELSIVLDGENVLTAPSAPLSPVRLTVDFIFSSANGSDDDSLILTASNPTDEYDNKLPSNSVTVESGTVSLNDLCVENDDGIIEVKGGELKVDSPYTGIYSNNGIKISGGKLSVAATGEDATGIFLVGAKASSDTGIEISGGELSVVCAGAAAIYAGDIDEDYDPEEDDAPWGGTQNIVVSGDDTLVEIEGGTVAGIYLQDSSLTIEGGTVRVSGTPQGIKATAYSDGIAMNGGELEVDSGRAAITLVDPEKASFTVAGDSQYAHKSYDGESADGREEAEDSELLGEATADSPQVSKKYVLITPAWPISYELGEGALPEGEENPEKYSRVDSFTLTDPEGREGEFSFTGWTGTELEDPATPVSVAEGSSGERSYTANYEPVMYEISFVDDDGKTAIGEAAEYAYGTPSGQIDVPEDPVKKEDEVFTYEFEGWDPELGDVTGDAVYTAVYKAAEKEVEIRYEAAEGGSVSSASETVKVQSGEAAGSEAAAEEGWRFSGWTDEQGNEVSADEAFVPEKADGIYQAAVYTANFTAIDHIKAKVIFKVYDGEWDEGGDDDITVELDVLEGEKLELKADDIPSAGKAPAEGFEEGAWDEEPVPAELADGDVVRYSYRYKKTETHEDPVEPEEPKTVTAQVSFKVVNGSWNDGSAEDKALELSGKAGEELVVKKADVPAAGSKPASGYKAGAWDEDPAGQAVASGAAMTFTYTYAKKSGSTGGGGGTPADLNGDDHRAYIKGYPDGTVGPDRNITRAEISTIFFRLLTDRAARKNLSTENSFSDVDEDAWYNTAVSTMAAMGIVSGYEDGSFRPDAPITRAELAVMAARFDRDAGAPVSSFDDVVGHWAQSDIAKAAQNGWVKGYEDGSFKPDAPITRAEAITLINRVLGRAPETGDDLLGGMVTWSDNLPSAWYYLAIQEAGNGHEYREKKGGFETWTKLLDADMR